MNRRYYVAVLVAISLLGLAWYQWRARSIGPSRPLMLDKVKDLEITFNGVVNPALCVVKLGETAKCMASMKSASGKFQRSQSPLGYMPSMIVTLHHQGKNEIVKPPVAAGGEAHLSADDEVLTYFGTFRAPKEAGKYELDFSLMEPFVDGSPDFHCTLSPVARIPVYVE